MLGQINKASLTMATKTFDIQHGKQVAIMYNLFPMLEEDKKTTVAVIVEANADT